MFTGVIIISSVIIQFVTVYLAIKLMRVTGNRISWFCISLSILFMAIRRCFSLYWFLLGDPLQEPYLLYEFFGFITSGLMLSGIVLISPLFKYMAKNITELEQSKKILQISEKKLRDITSNLAEGIYVFDERGHVSFMNNEAERILGWSIDDVKGKNIHDLIHHHKPDGTVFPVEECNMWQVIKSGVSFYSRDEMLIRKDGTFFQASVIACPIEENGNFISSVTAFRDITEIKKLEHEKENLISKLQSSLEKVKLLSGIIPICMHCKGIRDDKGYWVRLEKFITEHSEAEFSHGICSSCLEKHHPEQSNIPMVRTEKRPPDRSSPHSEDQ